MVFGGGRDKGQKFGKIKNGKSDEEERGKTCVARPNTRRSLVNVIENDVCALSTSYLFALKTRVLGGWNDCIVF